MVNRSVPIQWLVSIVIGGAFSAGILYNKLDKQEDSTKELITEVRKLRDDAVAGSITVGKLGWELNDLKRRVTQLEEKK